MLCLYLRGHSTFGGYFFTRWVLLHRPFNIWRQLGQKCLFRGSASIEVGWPQLLWILNLWQKSAVHAKFGHYRTSGSWVMSSALQKTSNARSPLKAKSLMRVIMPSNWFICKLFQKVVNVWIVERPQLHCGDVMVMVTISVMPVASIIRWMEPIDHSWNLRDAWWVKIAVILLKILEVFNESNFSPRLNVKARAVAIVERTRQPCGEGTRMENLCAMLVVFTTNYIM